MAIRVLDTSTGATFTFPITPQQITLSDGVKFIEYSLLDVGDVKFPSGSELTEVSFSGLLPGAKRGSRQYIIERVEPSVARDLWVRWRSERVKLRLTIEGTSFDDAVYLNTFSTTLEGGFGDYTFEISFVLAREIIIKTVKADEEDGNEGSRPDTQPERNTYTTLKGDTLYKIAKKMYGNGKKWAVIYTANTNTIKKRTAKLPGGLILVIP